ncbi:MAG: TetR/AcrR family transcriptional regulator [Deltaproteobacteria bacterium]|nr:TetR/AcrR family transcriptional regulator [Deltaproteobacteria bacterium]MBW2595890.1 TetR/AcrR family transcriptional regulator [Deltaproteobacteria bacterium]MBW2650309.1 TetR/AcrR family transcriptional regulator [Deltaproteobacteria bacterium]
MGVDKKQERKKVLEAFTRQGILDAAIGLLTRDGIQGLTMDRVAMEAGVAKGTLYVYFKNKEEILDATLDASFDPLIRELSVLLDDDRAPDRKLADFSLCHLRFFDEHGDLIRVLFFDRERMHSEKNHYTDSRYRTFVKRVADVLDEGGRQGLFVPLDSMKVAAMFIEANMGMIMQRIHDGISGDVEKDARQITDIFMEGLRQKKK